MTRTLVKGCALTCILLLTACGEGSSSSAIETTNTLETESLSAFETEKQTIALDNSGREVKGTFNGHKVVVYTDKVLTKETSNATKPIYGNIDGKSTTSLLAVNSNYEDGDVFWVKVFDGDEVVGESDEEVLSGEALEFGDVEIDGGGR